MFGDGMQFCARQPFGDGSLIGDGLMDRLSFGDGWPFGDEPLLGDGGPFGDRPPFGKGPAFGARQPFGDGSLIGDGRMDRLSFGEGWPFGDIGWSFGNDGQPFGDDGRPFGNGWLFGDNR